MNRFPLLAVTFVLAASVIPPAARAQAPNEPSPTTAPAVAAPASKPVSADPLKGLRVHPAALRSVPLAQPQAVLRAPRTVPSSFTPWAQEVPVIMTGASGQSLSSSCFR